MDDVKGAIEIVEASYRIEQPYEQWMTSLLELIERSIPAPVQFISGFLHVPATGKMLREVLVGDTTNHRVAVASLTEGPPDDPRKTWGHVRTAFSMSTQFGDTLDDMPFYQEMREQVPDIFALQFMDPAGYVVGIGAPLDKRLFVDEATDQRWQLLSAHITAGFRLIEHTHGDAQDAVLEPDGTVVHAEADAKANDARDALRAAAIVIDKARSKRGRDQPDSLEAWKGLVSGRWSLVDSFESDGRRMLVARRNDPKVADPRALPLRTRQVVAYAALGHSNKYIAYAMGLSESVVSQEIAKAMRNLQVSTRADLLRLFASHDPE